MSINIVDYCLKIYNEDKEELGYLLSRELRNKESESFEEAYSQEVRDYSIEISEKDIENLKLKDQHLDWVIIELNGDILNSESKKIIFKNRRMVFTANVNEHIDDNERFYFIGFKDNFVLR